MPGPRYVDWTHVHVRGDRERAALLLPEARKVLGFVQAQSAALNLPTYQVQRPQPDGSLIIAELIGGIPRITLVVPPLEPNEFTVRPPADFVVWARDETHVPGIDAVHPQQILRPEPWRTFFYDGTIDGYDDFTGPKRIYRFDAAALEVFPDGIRRAGNVDWLGFNGVRLSWYGPSTRMFTDPYVQPRSQFGKQVFCLGQVLLDVDAYDAASEDVLAEKWVMGAALRRIAGQRWLYVVHAELPVVPTPTDTVPANTTYFSANLAQGAIPLRLCRYRLSLDVEDDAMKLRVVTDSRESLWNASVDRATQPWFFAPSGEQAFSMAPPANQLAVVSMGSLAAGPDVADQRLALAMPGDTASYSTSTASIGVGNASAVLAQDYTAEGAVVQLRVQRKQVGDTVGALQFELQGTVWTLHAQAETGIPGQYEVQRSYLLHVDLRARAVLLVKERYLRIGNVISTGQVVVELWRRGNLVSTTVVPETYLGTGLPNRSDQLLFETFPLWPALSGAAIAPSFALYALAAALGGLGERFGGWAGGHGLYAYIAYPASELFGSYRTTAATPQPPLTIASLTDGGFCGSELDFDGKYSVLGCVTDGDITVFSAPPFQPATDTSIHSATGTTLPLLTGITGAQARFHPMWLLGKPPR